MSQIDETMAVDEENAAPASARRRRWPWAVAFAVTTIVVIASVVGLVQATADRTDARRAEAAQTRRVRHAHTSMVRAVHDRDRAVEAGQQLDAAVAPSVASVESLVQLAQQGLTASQTAQRIGETSSVAEIDAYNEAVATSNVIVHQMEATAARLQEQLRSLLGGRATTTA